MAANRIKGITIEIGGDVTGLNKALAGTNKEIKGTQSELKDVERLLKLDPTNTELMRQKQKLLADAVSQTKDKLQTLKEAERQAQEQFKRGEISQEQYDALKREVIATEQELKSLEARASETGGVMKQAFQVVGDAITDVGDKVQDLGGKIEGAGKALTPLSAAAAGVLGASGKMALSFEDAMAKASTLVDTTAYSMEDLSAGILAVSNETGVAAADLANSMYNALSASVDLGKDGADMMEFLHDAAILSKAGFTDVDTAVTATAKTLNAYGLEVSETSRIHNVMLKTQNLGITSVDELGQNLAKVTPTAAAMGVEFEQVGAALAVMTAQGTPCANATTQLNALISELGKEGTKSSSILKEKTGKSFKQLMQEGTSLTDVLNLMQTGLSDNATQISNLMSEVDAATGATMTYEEACDALGISSTELEGELIDLFGSLNAGKVALALGGQNADKFTESLGAMREGSDLVGESYEKLNTTSHRAGIALNTIKNTGIELGTTLLDMLQPALEFISEKVSQLSEWVSGLDEGQKQMIVTILAVVAAIGPLLMIIGKLTSGIGSVIKLLGFLAANPVVLVIGAIAALVAGIIYLWNNCDAFREGVTAIFTAIGEFIGNFVDGVVGFFTETIPAVFSGFSEFFQNIFAKDWSESFGGLGDIMNTFFGYFEGIFNSIKQVFTGFIDFFKNVFTGNWQGAWESIKSIVEGIWNGIWNSIKTVINLIIDGVNMLWRAVYKVVSGIVNAVGGVAGAIGSIFGQDWNFSMPPDPPLIPKLAKGGVIPPNNPFLVMYGDQRSHNNIESPEPLLREIVREESSGAGGLTVHIDSFNNYDIDTDIPKLTRRINAEMGRLQSRARRAPSG